MKKKGDEFVFEVGCFFYKQTTFSKPNWVLDKDGEGGWWMVDQEHIIHRIADPVELVKTSKRTEYIFKSFDMLEV